MSSPRNIGLYPAAISDFLGGMSAYRFDVLARRYCAQLSPLSRSRAGNPDSAAEDDGYEDSQEAKGDGESQGNEEEKVKCAVHLC